MCPMSSLRNLTQDVRKSRECVVGIVLFLTKMYHGGNKLN